MLFDPSDAKNFWLASRTGAGLFATSDGGTTLTRVGNLEAISRSGVDVSDPKKKLLLVCRGDKERDLSRSISGGSFRRIGNKLSEQILPLTQVVVIDAKTWLVATGLPPAPNPKKKKERERAAGIYRTDDAGASWLRCHTEGVSEPALQRADRSLALVVGHFTPPSAMAAGTRSPCRSRPCVRVANSIRPRPGNCASPRVLQRR